jgi:hypothetical protein
VRPWTPGVPMVRWLLILSVLLPRLAWGGPAEDAAVAADEAVSENCADTWGEHSGKPAAILAVGEALQAVANAYEADPQPFLLYYRGALYKCLGQFEEALDDLEAFVQAERANPAYAQQVKLAAVQLERAGRAIDAAGAGASAGWIRDPDHLEVSLRYGGGVAFRTRHCTEDPSLYYAFRCQDSGTPPAFAVGAAPVDGRFALTGFFARPIGIGVSLTGQWVWADESKEEVVPAGPEQIAILGSAPFLKNNSIDWGITHPAFVAAAGPVIRAANWGATGRASAIRIEPSFAVGIQWFEPVAGHRQWNEIPTGFQTFGGEWRVVQPGGSLRVQAQRELNNRALFAAEVRGAFFVPATGDQLVQTREAGGNVQVALDPIQADRVLVDGGFGVLLVPGERSPIAIGPDLRFAFDGRWLTFPEGEEHAWDGDASDDLDSKVFSTQRIKATVVVGLTLELGVPTKPR